MLPKRRFGLRVGLRVLGFVGLGVGDLVGLRLGFRNRALVGLGVGGVVVGRGVTGADVDNTGARVGRTGAGVGGGNTGADVGRAGAGVGGGNTGADVGRTGAGVGGGNTGADVGRAGDGVTGACNGIARMMLDNDWFVRYVLLAFSFTYFCRLSIGAAKDGSSHKEISEDANLHDECSCYFMRSIFCKRMTMSVYVTSWYMGN